MLQLQVQASKSVEKIFHLDLTLNALNGEHLSDILAWLDAFPKLRINLADNYLDWANIKKAFHDAGKIRRVGT